MWPGQVDALHAREEAAAAARTGAWPCWARGQAAQRLGRDARQMDKAEAPMTCDGPRRCTHDDSTPEPRGEDTWTTQGRQTHTRARVLGSAPYPPALF
jgi:hypothetical protein